MTDQKCTCTDHLVEDFTKNPDAALQTATAFELHPSTTAFQMNACVNASYENGQLCVQVPILGKRCITVSLPVPNNSTVSVCMSTCGFHPGLPPFKGVKATASFNGTQIWSGMIYGSC